ncbi:MAG: DUF2752 domain-containing protein [Lentisphaerota bacterium]
MRKSIITVKTAKFANWREWFPAFGVELLVFFLIFLFAIFGITPDDIPAGKYFGCYFRKITGLDCPGCGLTRGFIAFCHADFAEAFRVNALTYLVVPFFAYRLIRSVSATIFKKYIDISLPLFGIISIVILAFMYGFGRLVIEIGMKYHIF